MRVLVTRPQPQADAWVQRLRERGIDAVALPLLAIGAMADTSPLQQAWQALPRWVVFVSPTAVEHFFAVRPEACRWPDAARAAAPGPGTAQALRDAGVPAAQLIEPDASGGRYDSEALWERLRHEHWPSQQVLIVRGDGGRDWLAQTLSDNGAAVRFVQAYRRTAPQLDEAQRSLLADAVESPSSCVWLFSSSEAIGHLPALAPQADWSRAQSLTSHPRIAERARALGFGHVLTVTASLDAVHAALVAGLPQRA